MDEMKDPRFFGRRASEVFEMIRPELLRRSAGLKERGLVERPWLFGSVRRGDDTITSDIDLLVEMKKITFASAGRISEELADWVDFPIHLLFSDGNGYIPQQILEERVEI